MRIFQAIEATTNANIPGSKTWHRNLHEPLRDLGHQVTLFSTEEGRQAMQNRSRALRDRFSNRLLETFKKENRAEPYQLFFSYFMDGMIDPAVLDEIRHMGVPTCNFSANNAHQFYLVEQISPHFDFNLHTEKDAASKFSAIGARPLWWPMASNPTYFKPYDLPRTVPVSFVGENYALRARYIAALLESGIDVHAYGPKWQFGTSSRARSWAKRWKYLLTAALALSPQGRTRASAILADHDYRCQMAVRFPQAMHPPLSDDELIALYSRSQVSLGFLEVYHHHDPSQVIVRHLHLREFEAPMCGALYCTGYSPELAEFFQPDVEVVTYASVFELVDKVRYYLSHPAQAEQVRAAGRKRALADHTYQRRFLQLFEAIGLQ